jgi:hypothetical protein
MNGRTATNGAHTYKECIMKGTVYPIELPPINPNPRPYIRVMWDGNRCGGGTLRGPTLTRAVNPERSISFYTGSIRGT